jgi:predicted RNA-binding protein with RPS1 domain
MSKKSFLAQIQEIENKELEFNDHVLICIEADDNGIPVGSAVKVKGTPFQTLGMLDLAIRKLEEARESIHEKFETVENASRALNGMPSHIVEKIRKFEEEARQAMKDGDISKLEELKNKVKDELGISGDEDDSSDPDGFNINDFKGGF